MNRKEQTKEVNRQGRFFGKAVVLNRDFKPAEDGYHMIVPAGEWPGVLEHPDGRRERVVQVVDDIALDEIMGGFSGELLIDYEHFSHDPDKETVAAGWIRELERRPDGLYAKTRWSDRGKADIEGGNYRYVSPEFPGSALEILGDGRVRPLALDGAGLTNRPNMKMPPISNRGPGRDNQTNEKKMKEKLIKTLGLEAGATDEVILNKLAELTAAEATLRNRNQELETRVSGLEKERVEADLAAYSDVIPEQDREVFAGLLNSNRTATLKVLAASRAKIEEAGKNAGQPEGGSKLLNTEVISRKHPGEQPAGVGNDAKETARAAKIRNRASEIANKEGVTWATAWNRAEAEIQ